MRAEWGGKQHSDLPGLIATVTTRGQWLEAGVVNPPGGSCWWVGGRPVKGQGARAPPQAVHRWRCTRCGHIVSLPTTPTHGLPHPMASIGYVHRVINTPGFRQAITQKQNLMLLMGDPSC